MRPRLLACVILALWFMTSAHPCAAQKQAVTYKCRVQRFNGPYQAGPGAPPWRGPMSALRPARTLDVSPAPVDATTRAANVEAFRPWSATVTR